MMKIVSHKSQFTMNKILIKILQQQKKVNHVLYRLFYHFLNLLCKKLKYKTIISRTKKNMHIFNNYRFYIDNVVWKWVHSDYFWMILKKKWDIVYNFQIPRNFYSLRYTLKACMKAKFQKSLEIHSYIAEVVYIFIQAEKVCETHFV